MEEVARFDNVQDAVTATLRAVAGIAAFASDRLYSRMGGSVTVDAASRQHLAVFDIDETLLRDDNTQIKEVKRLYDRLKELGVKVFLVTARHPSMRDQTIRELKGIDVSGYSELLLSPAEYRTSMARVGYWKRSARQAIANKYKTPVLLTVGDQWTDLLTVHGSEELNQLDEAFGVAHTPWVLIRPNDGVAMLGLKLKD